MDGAFFRGCTTSAVRSMGLIYRKRGRWAYVDPSIPYGSRLGHPVWQGSSGAIPCLQPFPIADQGCPQGPSR